jgi:uroporphyrin-III C-methyltransferase
MDTPGREGGIVYLVGAGPGDPRLITVGGLEAVRTSQAIVYDRLINPALLREAPAWAERIPVGKRPGRHAIPQEAINALLIDRARAGLTVTRLKGGDPFVFGRGGEECEALRAAGVRYAVIPGVTSAIAVPGLAGIPVTHRRHSSAFAVITGHQCDDPSGIDWEALARIPTLIVLMGLGTLARTARRLIESGVPPAKPAAVVASGTLPHQRTVAGTLATIARLVREAGLEPPAVLVVGEVVRLREILDGTLCSTGHAGPKEAYAAVEIIPRSGLGARHPRWHRPAGPLRRAAWPALPRRSS